MTNIRVLVFLFGILLYGQPAFAAPAYVQGTNHQNGSGTSTTVAVTLGSPVASGDMVACAVGFAVSGADATTVADNKGNSYTAVDSVADTTDTYSWKTYYLLNITNGPQTITATLATTAGFASILCDEFSGIVTTSGLDGHAMQTQHLPGTGANAVTSGLFTTVVNGDLVWGAAVDVIGVGTISAGTGYTQRQSVASVFMTETEVQGTASASTATTYTASSASDSFVAGGMAFKAAAGGAAVLHQLLLNGSGL